MCILKVKMDPKLLTLTCQNFDFEDKGSIFMTSRYKRSPLQEKKIRLAPGLSTAMSCRRGQGANYRTPQGREWEPKILQQASYSEHSLLRNLLENELWPTKRGLGRFWQKDSWKIF